MADLESMIWLETPRLLLREFQQEDIHQLAPILANPKEQNCTIKPAPAPPQIAPAKKM